MSIQSSTKNIVKGIMISFDIFEIKDIQNVNNRISEIFGSKPTVHKTHKKLWGEPSDSHEINQTIWNIESLPQLFETTKHICDEKRFTCNFELIQRYVQSFHVQGYDSPELPFYVLIAKFILNTNTLNLSDDLRKDLLQVSMAIRLLVESLDGLTKWIASYSPRSAVITQLWVKLEKEHLTKMRETEIALLGKNKETYEVFEERKELSNYLRKLEPADLSDPFGDYHSHILNGDNVVIVLGHMQQLALGGLRTPYIMELSYDEDLLQNNFASTNEWIDVSAYSLDNIVWQGFASLIALISMATYLNYIASERMKIDKDFSRFRDIITQKGSEYTIDQMRETFFQLSRYGTQISSLLSDLGIFSRRWEEAIRQLSAGKGSFTLEVPIENGKLFRQNITLNKLKSRGYLETLAVQILQTLENTKESLTKQDSEISSLRIYISDFVNLKISKSNEDLQKSMKKLTIISILIAIMALAVSVISGWYSIQIASLDYQRTHPEGTYFVNIDFLGYDNLTNTDHFRVTITYQGRGESKFLRLSVGIVGINPTVASKGNVEVMEPNIIIARNYVDGLIGWVDYNIQRFASVNRTKLSIYDFKSDVNVIITGNP